MNSASFTENFDSIAADASQEILQKTVASAESGNISASLSNGGLLAKATSGWKTFTARSVAPDTGHKVHYYQFKHLSGDYGPELRVNGTTVVDFDISPKTGATDKSYFNKESTVITVIADYNPASPVATILLNGEVWKQVPVTKGASSVGLGFFVGTSYGYGFDDFSYAVYDARPEYSVKSGIYEGATMVKNEEETRTITVEETINGVVSEEAKAIEKVELLRDGVVVAESTTNVCALPNDLCGEFELEVKVTDIYGGIHSVAKYNYRVVDGTKNSYSVESQNFENVADADLAGIIAPGGNITATAELSTTAVTAETGLAGNYISDGKALKIANSTERSTYVQLGAPLDSGRKVHYYSFDIAMNGSYSKGVYLRKNTLNNATGQEVLIPKTAISTHSSNYAKISVKMIIDYDYKEGASPVAYISLDGGKTYTYKELTVIPSADVSPIVVLQGDNMGGDIYIDNYKYSGYDAPAKFGKGSGATDITFDTTPSSYNKVTFTTSYTNTTGAAVGVRYFFACYEEDGRMAHLYKPNHGNVKVKPEGFVYYYEDGAVDEKVDFQVNVAKSTNATSAKIFAYVIDDEGNIDFSPIGWY